MLGCIHVRTPQFVVASEASGVYIQNHDEEIFWRQNFFRQRVLRNQKNNFETRGIFRFLHLPRDSYKCGT
jgi:hypothetical protein